MARKRTIVLCCPSTPEELRSGAPSMRALGTPGEVGQALARFNTAPDGAARSATAGTNVFYGPGFVAEAPAGADEVTQLMVTMNEEDMAFQVLIKIAKGLGWKLMDPETGATFG